MVSLILVLQLVGVWGKADFALVRCVLTWVAFLFFWVLAAGCGITAATIRGGSNGIPAAAFSFLILASVTSGAYYILAGHASDADE